MNFEYGSTPICEDLFFEDIEKLEIGEQNNKLKTELKIAFYEKKELLRHIQFLNSQISKYSDLLYNGN
jgi:hypothetical protein